MVTRPRNRVAANASALVDGCASDTIATKRNNARKSVSKIQRLRLHIIPGQAMVEWPDFVLTRAVAAANRRILLAVIQATEVSCKETHKDEDITSLSISADSSQ
jgi:hypothetical protein